MGGKHGIAIPTLWHFQCVICTMLRNSPARAPSHWISGIGKSHWSRWSDSGRSGGCGIHWVRPVLFRGIAVPILVIFRFFVGDYVVVEKKSWNLCFFSRTWHYRISGLATQTIDIAEVCLYTVVSVRPIRLYYLIEPSVTTCVSQPRGPSERGPPQHISQKISLKPFAFKRKHSKATFKPWSLVFQTSFQLGPWDEILPYPLPILCPWSYHSGLVLVGSINGGQASNLCTLIAGGDVALSVTGRWLGWDQWGHCYKFDSWVRVGKSVVPVMSLCICNSVQIRLDTLMNIDYNVHRYIYICSIYIYIDIDM